jgi:hypothetical protein
MSETSGVMAETYHRPKSRVNRRMDREPAAVRNS